MVWSIFKVRLDDFCSYLVYLHFCRFDIGEDEEIPNLNAQEVPQPQVQSTLSSVLGDHSQAPTNPLTSSPHPEDPLGGVFLFPKLKCSFFFNSIINLDGYHIHPLPFFFFFFSFFHERVCVPQILHDIMKVLMNAQVHISAAFVLWHAAYAQNTGFFSLVTSLCCTVMKFNCILRDNL